MTKLLREDKTGKPDFTYIGVMYDAFADVMKHLTYGEKKYARLNWRNAESDQTYRESAARHLMQFIDGQTDEDHAVAAIVNLLIIKDLQKRI